VLKGEIDFRLGSEQRVCGQGDVLILSDALILSRGSNLVRWHRSPAGPECKR
jgi:hypothetical protein